MGERKSPIEVTEKARCQDDDSWIGMHLLNLCVEGIKEADTEARHDSRILFSVHFYTRGGESFFPVKAQFQFSKR